MGCVVRGALHFIFWESLLFAVLSGQRWGGPYILAACWEAPWFISYDTNVSPQSSQAVRTDEIWMGIHSFNRCLLSTFFYLSSVLDTWGNHDEWSRWKTGERNRSYIFNDLTTVMLRAVKGKRVYNKVYCIDPTQCAENTQAGTWRVSRSCQTAVVRTAFHAGEQREFPLVNSTGPEAHSPWSLRLGC